MLKTTLNPSMRRTRRLKGVGQTSVDDCGMGGVLD